MHDTSDELKISAFGVAIWAGGLATTALVVAFALTQIDLTGLLALILTVATAAAVIVWIMRRHHRDVLHLLRRQSQSVVDLSAPNVNRRRAGPDASDDQDLLS